MLLWATVKLAPLATGTRKQRDALMLEVKCQSKDTGHLSLKRWVGESLFSMHFPLFVCLLVCVCVPVCLSLCVCSCLHNHYHNAMCLQIIISRMMMWTISFIDEQSLSISLSSHFVGPYRPRPCNLSLHIIPPLLVLQCLFRATKRNIELIVVCW